MTRAQKQSSIESVNATLKAAEIALVVHNNGLTVSQMSALRADLRAVGAEFKISKNRLSKLAAKDTKFEGISDLFTGPTALATSADPVSVSKSLVDFAKTNDKLVIIGGAFGSQKLAAKDVETLAKLPSLNELRAKIVGMLQTPATRIACVLQAPGSQVARVISAHATKG
ncbi:MAG: 50S ribosomal protein L10 [Alphaproteobacteria bacterium]|nr:50S ribosomal protein L10 [Alphaproteobacteria bacterium]